MLVSAESIKAGHPDLVADQISANIIADILDKERKLGLNVHNMPHCGLEVFLGKAFCLVGGEVTCRVPIDVERIVRETVLSLGYNDAAVGLNGNNMGILNAIIPQSPDINIGTRAHLGAYKEIGAGDQGIMYGFAVDETPELLPLPYVLVNRLMRALENCGNPIFAPDGKGQVTVEYDDDTGRPLRVAKVLVSNAVDYRKVGRGQKNRVKSMARQIAFRSLGKWVDSKTEFYFNPTGEWSAVNSCSAADSGVTGRKLVVQFYGGYPGAQVGGGSVVNKSPEKVDCSAAFGARYAAKNLVAAGLARKVSIQLAYAIGIAKPFNIYVNTFGTGKLPDKQLSEIIARVFDFTPAGMIQQFELLKGDVYRRIPKSFFLDGFRWERTDRVARLKKEAGLR